MKIIQKIFGFLNNQVVNNNITVVDSDYLKELLKFEKNPSDLNEVILTLYNCIPDSLEASPKSRSVPPEIEEKIEFNEVKRFKEVIEANYSETGFYLDEAYGALDENTPGRKKRFLSYINSLYLLELGQLIKDNTGKSKQDIVKENADEIINKIIIKLLLRISNNSKSIEHISSESIEINVIAIVCHAFVDCKVLENPYSS